MTNYAKPEALIVLRLLVNQISGQTLGSLPDLQTTSIVQSISSIPYAEHHRNEYGKILPGTGQWLLQGSHFESWLMAAKCSTLWLRGIRMTLILSGMPSFEPANEGRQRGPAKQLYRQSLVRMHGLILEH